jgi:hypothetical protein
MTPLELKNQRNWLTGQSPWDVELEPRSQQASDSRFSQTYPIAIPLLLLIFSAENIFL